VQRCKARGDWGGAAGCSVAGREQLAFSSASPRGAGGKGTGETPVAPLDGQTPSAPRCIRLAALLPVSWSVLFFVGCGAPPPAEFPLNTEGRDPASISRVQREAIVDALGELFGTPDAPRLPDGVALDLALIRQAAGPVHSDEQGRNFGLYRKHCVTCHGLGGTGAGPTAALLSPYPRDFRPGVFKFTSTAAGAKATADDLARTLRRGAPGTAMPSFGRLPVEEQEALVEYVRYLALRGEVELYLLRLVVDEEEYLPLELDWVMEDAVEPLWSLWSEAPEYVVEPKPRASIDSFEQWQAAVARGRELYLQDTARCVECHGPEGHGDGEQRPLYDDWNKPKLGMNETETSRLAALFSLPLQSLPPRNFHEGAFRGGDRPLDLFWRIHVGIKGTPMPAGGPSPGVPGPLGEEDIWHLVAYIRSLAGEGPADLGDQ